eukprot:c22347_g1_i2 orf=310-1059(+)
MSEDSGSEIPKVGAQMDVLKEMRFRVQQLDAQSTDCDDAMLMRFLIARNFNVEKASKLFIQHLKWRRSFVPFGYIPENEILNELKQKKIFLQGCDKKGCPVGLILAARHNAFKRNMEEFKRFVVYNFDKAIASVSSKEGKFVIIADLEGWSYKNADVRGYLAILGILQDHYPERLEKLFMLHVPYMFWGIWKLVYPFIDKVTREKIIFVEDACLHDTLLKEIDKDQLPDIYGGKLPLVPVQDSSTSNWS